jgi:hypothetical protein
MTDFDVFQRINARTSNTPTMTITARGTFNFNKAAYELLGKPDAVILLYARNERTIGLTSAGKDEPNAYLMRHTGSGQTTWTVIVRQFCAWAGIDLSESRRYPLTMGTDGMGRVSLGGPSRVVTSNRKPR